MSGLSIADVKRLVLAAKDRIPEPQATPEWPEVDGQIFLVPMSGVDRDRYDQVTSEKMWPVDDHGNPREADWRGIRAFALSLTMCDAAGELFAFSAAELATLGEKSGAVIDRLFERVKVLSGLKEKAKETAAKNSSAAASGESG